MLTSSKLINLKLFLSTNVSLQNDSIVTHLLQEVRGLQLPLNNEPDIDQAFLLQKQTGNKNLYFKSSQRPCH